MNADRSIISFIGNNIKPKKHMIKNLNKITYSRNQRAVLVKANVICS